MTIIGIDPSLSATGIATASESYVVRTKADDPTRLAVIFTAVRVQVTAERKPAELAVVEDLPTHARGAGLTGMAQGVIRLALIESQVPYVTIPAATLKKYATGKGNATKADMRMAWYQRAGDDVRDDNEVDALWLRQIGLTLVGDPDAIPLPKTHLDALAKVTLP